GGRDRDERDLDPRAAQARGGELGLRQRQPTAAAADAYQHTAPASVRAARTAPDPAAAPARTPSAPAAAAAARASVRGPASRPSALVLETEQVPHRLSIEHPVGCRGRLLHAHGRQVEQLVDDLGGDRLDGAALAVVEPSQKRLRLAQLGLPDLLGPRPQRGDRGHHVEGGVPLAELLRLGGDDRLRPLRLAATSGQRLGDDRLEIVDVVEVTAVEVVDRRVEVPRDGEVDEQELTAATLAERSLDGGGVEHVARSARGGDDDVGAGQLLLDPLERERLGAEPARQLLGAVERAVGDERDPRPTREEVASRLLADLAGAHEQDRATLQVAEDLLRERSGGRGDRRRALADRRLGARLASRVQGLPEGAVEHDAGGAEL